VQDEVVVVVAGGKPPRPEAVFAVPVGARVIAADGGLAYARALGIEVELVVGDLDSAAPADIDAAARAGTSIERHPAEKDATDLELALEAALALEPSRVLVLAGGGGRLDHFLAMLLLLGSHRWAAVELDAEIGSGSVRVIRGERVFSGRVGELVSLLALHGPAAGVRTEGLAYPLNGETLEPGSSRGVSNVFAAPTAKVTVERGVLLGVCPGPESDDAK
jgi:thiamine pyrophosphokinase